MNTSDLTISEQELSTFLGNHGVTNAAVFGSFARGDAGSDSDLDLLVTYRSGTTLFDVLNLQDELEKILGRKVDLISERRISTRLERRIKKDLKPLIPKT
jgi:predicted nucleotidyltransferase